MNTAILLAVISAMVVTSIVSFAKPAYKKLACKDTINIALSFILGIVASFAIYPWIEWELTTGAIILIGLAIGTGSNIFYDILSTATSFKKKNPLD